MEDIDYGTLLFALLGELAARELSLKVGRNCVFTPDPVEATNDERIEIAAEYDLCAHLPLGSSGQRSALLLSSRTADQLVGEARKRGTLESDGRRLADGVADQCVAGMDADPDLDVP